LYGVIASFQVISVATIKRQIRAGMAVSSSPGPVSAGLACSL